MTCNNKIPTAPRMTSRLLLTLLASFLLLVGTGCEQTKVVNSANNQQQAESPKGNNQPGGKSDATDPEDDTEEEFVEGHGSEEEDNNHVAAGFMNGTWRAGAGEQDEPAVYFDTFQDEGDSTITGQYTMGFAIYELYDGESGDISSAEFTDGTLTVLWNPTTDPMEMFSLEATRVDQNTLQGTITAKRNPELNLQVTLTRTNTD